MNNEYQAQYQKENLRQIRLKINRKTEPELLAWVEKQGNIQGYIKQLIMDDMKKGRGNMKKQISVNNGHSFVDARTAIETIGWDAIVNAMDDETREKVHEEGIETEEEFLERYLEAAPHDIVIG